jgi:hypothetical protein
MSQVTDNPTITEIGVDLYGSCWQRELAKALGVNERTVRRWAAGGGVPRDIELVLSQLALARAKRLRYVAKFLEEGRLQNKKSNGMLGVRFDTGKRRPLIVFVPDEQQEPSST